MSWWDIDDHGSVIGDEPADLLGDMFAKLDEQRGTEPRLTLQELVDTVQTVINEDRANILDESGPVGRFERLRARLQNNSVLTSRVLPAPRPRLEVAIHRCLLDIARAYGERWRRKPRANEIARAFVFVMRVDTETYVSDVRTGELVDIEAETAPAPQSTASAPPSVPERRTSRGGWRRFGAGRGMIGADTENVMLDLFEGLGEPKPSFQHVLDLVASLMRREHAALLAPGGQALHGLKAELKGDTTVRSSHANVADEDLEPLFLEAMKKVSEIYEAGQGRKPTAAEMAYTFCYVLRTDTDEYFSDDPPVEVSDILPT